MKTLKSEIMINAPVEDVWKVLMDHGSYPEWNPFIKQISGSVEKGETMLVTIQPPDKDPMSFTPVVLKNDKNKEFRWLGKLFIKGLFDGEHYFQLEAVNSNRTRLIHGENFRGVLAGVLLKMIGENTLRGFHLMNQSLKKKVEKAA